MSQSLIRFSIPFISGLFSVALFSCNSSKEEGGVSISDQISSYVAANGALTEEQMKLAKMEIKRSEDSLSDGCLVLRSDNDYESLTLMNFSKREKLYSHAGIVFKEDSGWMVYHSMTGVENPSGAVRKDPYSSFVDPDKKTGFGLYRYAISSDEIQKLHEQFKAGLAKKIPFDIRFNLLTDDSMYCSEMIYKSLRKVTDGRVVLPTSTIRNFKPKIMGYKLNHVFFKRFDYVGLDDLYLNPYCKKIMSAKYN